MWEIKISELLYHPNTIWGVIFDCIGETPALIPIVYCAFILGGIIFKNKNVLGRKRELLSFSCYLTCVLLLSVMVVATLKSLWGRARFYDLTPPLYDGYTPFYVFGNGGNSFPSGHASMSSLSFLLVDANEKHPLFSKKTPFIFAFLFTTLVCVSRLTEGAHFITDVVAGVVVTLTTRLVLKRLLFRKLLTSS